MKSNNTIKQMTLLEELPPPQSPVAPANEKRTSSKVTQLAWMCDLFVLNDEKYIEVSY